jgi:hypothetical protein
MLRAAIAANASTAATIRMRGQRNARPDASAINSVPHPRSAGFLHRYTLPAPMGGPREAHVLGDLA